MRGLNLNHLYYFWVVARQGSIARAAETLHLTPQTISGQLSVLEHALGTKLFRRSGRQLVLTDGGRLALSYAEDIFRLSTEMENVLEGATGKRELTFTVGIVDVVPKMVAYRLLEPALAGAQDIRIVCREGKLDALLAELALHQLDLVLADTPMSPAVNIRAYNHLLGESGTTFFAADGLAKRYAPDEFPRTLNGAPLLLPATNTALRAALMQWFEQNRIRPKIMGEFEDSALMQAFGEAGIGIFTGPTAIEDDIVSQYGVRVVGRADAVRERFYAISAERRLRHPAVVAISETARTALFTSVGG